MLKRFRNKLLLINVISLMLVTAAAFSTVYFMFRGAVFSSADTALQKALVEFSPARTAFVPQIPSSEDFEVTVTIYDGELPNDKNIRYMTKNMPDGSTLIAECDISAEQKLIEELALILAVSGIILIVLIFFISLYTANRSMEPLKQSMEIQEQFVSDASHELKTPLTAINANLDIITPTEEQKKWFDNIRYETDRMIRLTRSLLTLSGSGRAEGFTDVSLSDICLAAVLSAEASAFEKGITVDCDIDEDIVVYGNTGQLEQLMAILLDNAVKYNQDGGFVKVGLAKRGHWALVSVENTGKGISDQDKERIFRRFYRGDKSRSTDGFGLGLPIACRIVNVHGGKISVKNGKTTVFSVSLGLKREKAM